MVGIDDRLPRRVVVIGGSRRLAVVALAALIAQPVAFADDAPSPSEYLMEVLDVVEHRAYHADRIDWAQWRTDAAEAATA